MRAAFAICHWRFAIFALLALTPDARAEDAVPVNALRVWLEPKFQHSPVATPVTGAKATWIAAGTLRADELAGLSASAFAALGISWEQFFARARENGAADLAGLKPRYERDAKKVIVYAALESEKPVVASAVLAPKFLAMFKDTLGDKLLVVVPNRFTAFVFPRLASHYAEYAPMVFRAYRATAWPVSVEVFEVSADGWRGFGAYEEP